MALKVVTESTRFIRRQWIGTKLTRQFHVYHTGIWVVICFALVSLLCVSVYLIEAHAWTHFPPAQGADPSHYPVAHAHFVARLLVGSVIITAGLAVLGLAIAHRIAGPYRALIRTFNRVRAGDLTARLTFRETDHLDDVADSFNEMMDTLTAAEKTRSGRHAA